MDDVDPLNDSDPFGPDLPKPKRSHGFKEKPGLSAEEQLAALDAFGDPEKTGKFIGSTKRKKSTDAGHTKRTMDMLEKAGWKCWRVETWQSNNQGRRWKLDLLGIGDIMAITPKGKTVLVQVTTMDDVQGHLRKLWHPETSTSFGLTRNNAFTWLAAGNGILIISWEMSKGRYVHETLVVTAESAVEFDRRRRKA